MTLTVSEKNETNSEFLANFFQKVFSAAVYASFFII